MPKPLRRHDGFSLGGLFFLSSSSVFLHPFFFPLWRPLLVFNFRVHFACSRLCSLFVFTLCVHFVCSPFAFTWFVYPLCSLCVFAFRVHFAGSLLCSLSCAFTFASTFRVHFCVHFLSRPLLLRSLWCSLLLCSLSVSRLVFSPFCRPVLAFSGPAGVRCFWGVCPQLFGWVVFFCTFEHSCASFFGLAPSVGLVIFGATHLDSRSR
jgi:hypothetical protein